MLLVSSLLWASFYAPMSIAVVAIERTLNPLTVLTWTWKCMPDYFWCCLVSGVFTTLVNLVSHSAQGLFLDLGPTDVVPAYLLGLTLNQYNAAATLTALGLLLRRNRAQLGW